MYKIYLCMKTCHVPVSMFMLDVLNIYFCLSVVFFYTSVLIYLYSCQASRLCVFFNIAYFDATSVSFANRAKV